MTSNPDPKPKRPYTSVRRRLQADQTRQLILEAARKLFYERGYPSTTMDAIAQEAGVAPETVYAVFGSKQAILRKLIDVTVVGDEAPEPLLERSFVKEAAKEKDPRQLIRRFAGDIYQIMQRMSPVFALLRATAKTDPEIAAIQARLLQERMGGMKFFVEMVERLSPLREMSLPNQASTSVWALSSGEVFELLTQDLGWSEDQYVTWLSDALIQLLLP